VKRILVQAGHQRPLQPGHEDQTGAPGEAELVAAIQRALVKRLNDDPDFHGVPMPGLIDDDVRVDGALFLHADGSTDASARGFSLGYPDDDVNKRLANLIADEFKKLDGHPPQRPDNNTVDRHEYYGFHHVSTPGPEVLVEHGFVTNHHEHHWMTHNIDELAAAEHNALRRYFGLSAIHTPADAPVASQPVSTATTLLAARRAPSHHALRYLLDRDHGGYSDDEVGVIVRHYYNAAESAGLDPLLAVAQMAEETAHLTSFWSQPPRRNLAGIGVTGAPGVGATFDHIRDAVHAHVGRLLAYALPAGSETAPQKALVDEALAVRPLPSHLRGAAPTLAGLAGTWAADPAYATKIAAVANDIRAV
jgi:hypothetical protein